VEKAVDLSSYKSLLLERDGKVLNVTLNRPDAMNAFDPAMEAETRRMLLEVAHDAATHVVVLTGAGRAFSAGGDLNQIREVMEHPEMFFRSIGEAKQHRAEAAGTFHHGCVHGLRGSVEYHS
jgi:enoyl-CoA hydratase